jgi:2-polyprenyl-6-methoxyphenol hydroxylase-like FAD-dependent oxidoreductase
VAGDDSSPARPDVNVLVVGAGPTGLALAAELTRYGTSFRLVDRQLDRVHESRALGVQPRTLELLARLGVADELIECGNPAIRLQLHFGRRVVPVRLFDIGIDDTAYPYLLFVSQAETERILGEYVSRCGGTLERGVELVKLAQTSSSVSCLLRDRDGRDETVSARYVVGCDGAHSTVREQAGIAFEGSAYPQTFVLADLEADGIDPGYAHAFVSARGILFFFPLGEPATWRILAMRPRTSVPTVEEAVTIDEVQALVDGYTTTPIRVRDPVWMTNFRLHNRGAARYRAGRVFLAGDAAHIHSPAGAQGMNTGIQDAVNLGWKLALVAASLADPALLDSYEPERAPVGRLVLRFTDRAFTIATSPNPVLRFARAQLAPLLAPLVLHANAGRAYGFRTVSQLGIRYRSSPLSVEGADAPRRGPHAGDRLPDAPVTHDGQVGTLHRTLVAPGFHLLLCGPPDAWPAAAFAPAVGQPVTVYRLTCGPGGQPDLIDHTGLALDRLGVAGDDVAHYLVRPDGYIGFRGGADLSGVRAYLTRLIIGLPE